MEEKTQKNRGLWLILGVVLALGVVVGLYFGIRALTRNSEPPDAGPSSEQLRQTEPLLTESVPADVESSGESETMDQDELDIQAAKAKKVYTDDSLSTEDARLDQIIATCADYSINNHDAQIYYAMQFYSFMQNYADIAPYFGLDSTQPLYEQVSTVDDLSWEQYFLMSALDDFHQYAALAAKAAAEGFTMPEQFSKQLSEVRDGLQERYAEFGYDSADAYIQANFGLPVRYEDYVKYLELYFTAMAYKNSLYDTLTVSDKELNDYYDTHPDSFEGIEQDQCGVNVRHILIMPDAAEDASEAEKSAANAAAKAKAEELLAAFRENPSESAFAELASQNTQDPGSKDNGGLYENVMPGRMFESFDDWCFDESRKPGDTGIVETSYGYHVMYFVSVSDTPYWITVARDSILSDRLFDQLEELLAEYPMTTNYDDAFLAPLPKQVIN